MEQRLEWDENILGEKREKYQERDWVKWVPDRTGSLNSASSKSRQMQVSRGIEISVEGGVEKMVVDSWGIEEVSRNNPTESRTEARLIHQVSRSYQRWRPILDRSTRYREAVGIAIRKSWRSSIDSKVSRRCRASFLKAVFQDLKNTDMNATQHATQPMIQLTY